MEPNNQKENITINLPKDVASMLDKILAKNPDFEDKEFLIQYCVRRYYEDMLSKSPKK